MKKISQGFTAQDMRGRSWGYEDVTTADVGEGFSHWSTDRLTIMAEGIATLLSMTTKERRVLAAKVLIGQDKDSRNPAALQRRNERARSKQASKVV